MNRRRFLIALAVVLPLAIFIPAKIAASWRPILVGEIVGVFPQHFTRMSVGDDAVLARYMTTSMKPFRFDLATGEVSVSQGDGFTRDGKAQWQWESGKPSRLATRRGEMVASYELPADFPTELRFMAKVVDSPQNVDLLSFNRYCRWDKTSRRAKRDVKFAGSFWNSTALTRDGEAMVSATPTRILRYATRDGSVIQRIPVAKNGVDFLRARWISNFGSYAGYEGMNKNSSTRYCDIYQTRNGRKVWSFGHDKLEMIVLSSDENELARQNKTEGIWQIHDLKSGAKLRTLPLLPDVISAAFSPDGATLYSLTEKQLYRQRTR